MTKATTAQGDQMQYGINWALARRGILKVFEDRLVCGDWTIPNAQITEATLYSIRSSLFLPGYVLKVQTAEQVYHFGLNGWLFWKGELPFPVTREQGKLSYSLFSIIARILALGCLIYLFWKMSN